eukprot:789132-Karenia_brevis.AAC.1
MARLAAAAYCCKLRCVAAEKACLQAEMAALKLTSQAKDSSVASPGTMASHAATARLPCKLERRSEVAKPTLRPPSSDGARSGMEREAGSGHHQAGL